MTYQVKLEMFEGPLDLLLHLIREHQLDILDIPMATITDEYLRYLSLMQELDLDVAGEFLLMAATLIHIKSKMLLPPEESAEGEEAEEEDPRAELVDRLLEYKKFKEAAQTLGVLETEQGMLHRRGAPAIELTVEGPLTVSLFELMRAFRDVLRRADVPTPLEITPEELNVGQRIVHLLDRLAAESPLEFTAPGAAAPPLGHGTPGGTHGAHHDLPERGARGRERGHAPGASCLIMSFGLQGEYRMSNEEYRMVNGRERRSQEQSFRPAVCIYRPSPEPPTARKSWEG
ncbi:MAG: segregation/condensation protein A [candidate division NC10 bacterium]|nr:segregation/condensation protein A [candidate division NC10 bacterium]